MQKFEIDRSVAQISTNLSRKLPVGFFLGRFKCESQDLTLRVRANKERTLALSPVSVEKLSDDGTLLWLLGF